MHMRWPVPRELLKTSAFGLGFQQLPRDLANVNACNAWKNMFDPYIENDVISQVIHPSIQCKYIYIWKYKFV